MTESTPWALLLRTPPSAHAMAQSLRAQGIEADALPLQYTRASALTAALRGQIDSALGAQIQIFVSVAAVHACQRQAPQLLAGRRIRLAVGGATARALQQAGVTCHSAAIGQEHSEGLLLLEPLIRPAGKHIVILAARGGRDALRATLQARGAKVQVLPIYQRVAMALRPAMVARLRAQSHRAAVLAGSAGAVQALAHACASAGLDALLQQPLIVPSARVARAAERLRFSHIEIADGASQEAMLAALLRSAAGPA